MAYTADIHEVAVLMSRLQQNYSQLANNWYNIFFDPTPKNNITVTWWDEDGNQITETLPNRAWDNQYILHGTGSPEGVVIADVGSVYYDTSVGDGYLKKVGATTSTGWDKFASMTEFNNYILKGTTSPEGQITAPIGTLYTSTVDGKFYIKKTGSGNTGWVEPSVSVQEVLDMISQNSANQNLSNLTTTGEKHFINKTQISNCILEAPNGVCTSSTTAIVAKHGTNYLLPNGRNTDGTLVNIEHSLTVDQNFTPVSVVTGTVYEGFLTYNNNIESFICVPKANVYYSESEPITPTAGVNAMWFNPLTNYWNYTVNGTSWAQEGVQVAVPMCDFEVDSSSNITNLVAKKPVSIVKYEEFNKLNDRAVLADTNQTITGSKTFTNATTFSGNTVMNGTLTVNNTINGITTTEFNCLDGVTSNIQAQLNTLSSILSAVYPVGSIYIGTQETCPLTTLISGSTWEQIQGRYLLASGTINGTSESISANGTLAAGLPNITGYLGVVHRSLTNSGAFNLDSYADWNAGGSDWNFAGQGSFYASRSSSIYGNSATVRPTAYGVNVWRRTA